jgi:hypothetical protein
MSGIVDLIRSFFDSATGSAMRAVREDAMPIGYQHRRGLGHRNERIHNEILMIAPRFAQTGGVYYDEEGKDWLMIPRYPLPERWADRWCGLMIIFPPTYPETAPIGFYLNKKYQLKNGNRDNHLIGQGHYGAPDLTNNGWFWYCVRTTTDRDGGWQSSADYTKPDNLWTFLTMIRESLTNDF